MWYKELKHNEVKHCKGFQVGLLTFYSHIYIFIYVYKQRKHGKTSFFNGSVLINQIICCSSYFIKRHPGAFSWVLSHKCKKLHERRILATSFPWRGFPVTYSLLQLKQGGRISLGGQSLRPPAWIACAFETWICFLTSSGAIAGLFLVRKPLGLACWELFEM